MKRFIEGGNRNQITLMPACLDDYIDIDIDIDIDNPVRVIDLFVDKLDLAELGFEGTTAANTGRPGYHPALLLKIYIYGYRSGHTSHIRFCSGRSHGFQFAW